MHALSMLWIWQQFLSLIVYFSSLTYFHLIDIIVQNRGSFLHFQCRSRLISIVPILLGIALFLSIHWLLILFWVTLRLAKCMPNISMRLFVLAIRNQRCRLKSILPYDLPFIDFYFLSSLPPLKNQIHHKFVQFGLCNPRIRFNLIHT